jgi:hypothetical protein
MHTGEENMATGTIGNPDAGSLRQLYASAIGELTGDCADVKARTPIYQRNRAKLEDSPALSTERALSDAAQALAALWKAAPGRGSARQASNSGERTHKRI